MAFFKPLLDAVGSGGGVAWSAFGIISATMGLASGGVLSLIFGYSAISAFLLIFFPVLILSYQAVQKQQQQLAEKIIESCQMLQIQIRDYLELCHKHFLKRSPGGNIDEFRTSLSRKIDKDLRKLRLSNKGCLADFLQQIFDRNTLNQFIHHKYNTGPLPEINIKFPADKRAPFSTIAIASFFGFIGGFGAVAGGSAGISGLLMGMGLFAGFTAMPILGWSLLAAALLVAALAAFVTGYDANSNHQMAKRHEFVKNQYQSLFEINLDKDLGLAVSVVPLAKEDKRALVSSIKESLIGVKLSRHKLKAVHPAFFEASDNGIEAAENIEMEDLNRQLIVQGMGASTSINASR
ncbi:hypothetical protein ACFORL_04520 [Legionella dresdenensis]|uniref:Uncharacterized protein n=1 Tax=Legionella dresdenensis TaxID=450200 RepID=A0ABV8CDG2_9GAMM